MEADSLINNMCDLLGMDMFEEEIDDVIFATNEFLTDATFVGSSGPFWWILEMCMALGACFAIVMAAGMAYKMMVKGETFDIMKILRVLGIAIIMFWWYPNGRSGQSASFLGILSYIPNAIGSFTHDLYEAEAYQVQEKLNSLTPLVQKRDTLMKAAYVDLELAKKHIDETGETGAAGTGEVIDAAKGSGKLSLESILTGATVALDKLIMILSMMIFRIGWWGTMYCQQILLGMLTIFGPIQWAFSILPKWEGAWAKWIIRYLTVHFYGAMLYFVGFYVLLLFDIVLTIQYENLQAITATTTDFSGYMTNAFMTAGYLLVASIVSLKCLNLVPDLAAYMIPEGDTAFSTRNFGEGVASSVKQSASSAVGKVF